VEAGLDAEVEMVEAPCADPVRRGQCLRADGAEAWPDGTLTERDSFRHTLCQQVGEEPEILHLYRIFRTDFG
jgi:hypothetical protein